MRDELWQEQATALKAFRGSRGRWPTKDGPGQEDALEAWRGCQRRDLKDGRMRQDRKDWLDRNLPGWAGSTVPLTPEEKAAKQRASEARWQRAAEAVVAFRASHGRLPTSVGAVPGETDLGVWLETHRRRLPTRKVCPAHRAWLDENLPGWRTP